MNCIDAIEGTIKAVLKRICTTANEDAVDMSDYIRRVQAVLDATRIYVVENPEITPEPDVLLSVLYDFARDSYIEMTAPLPVDAPTAESDQDMKEYAAYCFDYIYAHGTYPL